MSFYCYIPGLSFQRRLKSSELEQLKTLDTCLRRYDKTGLHVVIIPVTSNNWKSLAPRYRHSEITAFVLS